jgi:hypothetical protein
MGILLMAAPAASAASLGDRACGFGVRAPSCADGCPAGSFGFDARSGRHGGHPTGWFTVDFPGYATFTGAVTCLNVHNRWATIFGKITSGTGAADPTTFPPSGTDPVYFVVVVHNKGPQRFASPAPDEMSLIGWDTEAGFLADPGIALADICGDPWTALGNTTMFTLVAGNIRVVDR